MSRSPADESGNGAHAPVARSAEFRFYEELNDFLPTEARFRAFMHEFTGTPSVKDRIEAIGVPHTEIDLIVVDGASVGFGHRLHGGERVAVYPMFEGLDISPLTRLRPRPLRVTRFIADAHLGKLARYLRLVGFDTLWRNDIDDRAIIDAALSERRIILTRNRGILRDGRVTHGYWLRATEPFAQLEEVVRALELGPQLCPFSRCPKCNGTIRVISRAQAATTVPRRVSAKQTDFGRCDECGRVYWSGSHQAKLDAIVERARVVAGDGHSTDRRTR